MIHEGIYKWLVLLRENMPREISLDFDMWGFAYMRRRLWGLMPDKTKIASSVYSQDESSFKFGYLQCAFCSSAHGLHGSGVTR